MHKNFFYITGSLIIIFAFIPVFIYGIFNPGVYLPALFGIYLIFVPRLSKLITYHKVKIFIWILTIILLSIFFIMLIIMIYQSNQPVNEQSKTVIVLGCEVRGEEPSLMLKTRLDTAQRYLTEHKDAVCIVTGGLGDNAYITEAECMKRYLVTAGISEDRIYLDNFSENTEQNLQNASQIIKNNKLDRNTVIITDAYHTYRAMLYAKKFDLIPTPYASHAPFFLQQSYWIRDMLGLIKYIITNGN